MAGYLSQSSVAAPEQSEDPGSLNQLFQQIELGNEAEVLRRIESGFHGNADVADEPSGVTPLIRASIEGQVKIVQALIERRADVMKADSELDNPLMFAISGGYHELVQIFLTAGADSDVPNRLGQTPLMKAVTRNDLQTVNLLLEQKANPNATTRHKKTSLLLAAEKNSVELVDALLKVGADPNIADETGLTALFPASFRGNAAILRLLIDAKADTTVKARSGTALMMVIDSPSCRLEALTLLVASGCGIDAQNPHGDTALIMAAERNVEHGAKALIEAKADPSIANKEGKTALDVAREQKNVEVERLLSP